MSEKRKVVRSVSSDICTVSYLSNGITEIRFTEKYEVKDNDVEEISEMVSLISESKNVRILVIPGAEGSMHGDTQKDGFLINDNVSKIAIIAPLLHQRILGNIYFKFKKTKFSNYRMFRKEADAYKWLLEEEIDY